MTPEAYSVAFEKANYHAPVSDVFNPEIVKKLREESIKDNLLSYAGEYRLGVKFDEYFYRVEEDISTGDKYLASKERGPVRDIYRKAIKNRERNGLSTKREVAECLGFERLEKVLVDAPDRTMAVWVSPPGDINDGYGGYSFTFIGQVEEDIEGRKIRMIPYRNINTLEEHSAQVSKIARENITFQSDIDALSSPIVVKPNDEIKNPEDILRFIGEDEAFDVTWKKELEEKAQPFINAFLYLVRTNASDEELIKVRNAFENFAIAMRQDKNIEPIKLKIDKELMINDYRLSMPLINKWGYEPPKAAGSCGSTVQESSILTPMEYQTNFGLLAKDSYGERTFNCPRCKKENIRPHNKLLTHCQHCKSDKVAC